MHVVSVTPDGGRVASGGKDGHIYVWNTTTGDMIFGPMSGHAGAVLTVVYSPDGQCLVSESVDKSIIVWDSSSGTKLFQTFSAHSDWIRSISFHPSGTPFVTGSYDKTIAIWGIDSFKPTHGNFLRFHTDSVRSTRHSPNGRFILSASWDGKLGYGTRGGVRWLVYPLIMIGTHRQPCFHQTDDG